MLSRALAPVVLCASATWPVAALACLNSMDSSAISFTQPLWLDLLLWTVGAVFLNSVVLVNVLGPATRGQPAPSWFRRSFFAVAGVCLVLVLATVLAGGPLLSLGGDELAKCSIEPSGLVTLVLSPAVLFVVQAGLFQGAGKRWLGDKTGAVLAGLVLTSALLAMAMGLARDEIILPEVCGFFDSPY